MKNRDNTKRDLCYLSSARLLQSCAQPGITAGQMVVTLPASIQAGHGRGLVFRSHNPFSLPHAPRCVLSRLATCRDCRGQVTARAAAESECCCEISAIWSKLSKRLRMLVPCSIHHKCTEQPTSRAGGVGARHEARGPP